MKSQVLHTVWCNISGEAAGEIWHWSLSGVKGLSVCGFALTMGQRRKHQLSFLLTAFYYPDQLLVDNALFQYSRHTSFNHLTDAVSLVFPRAGVIHSVRLTCLLSTHRGGAAGTRLPGVSGDGEKPHRAEDRPVGAPPAVGEEKPDAADDPAQLLRTARRQWRGSVRYELTAITASTINTAITATCTGTDPITIPTTTYYHHYHHHQHYHHHHHHKRQHNQPSQPTITIAPSLSPPPPAAQAAALSPIPPPPP